MSSSENLLKAAFNRISMRLGKQLVNTANDLSQKAKDTPEQIKTEWEVLKQEIITEANRLEAKPEETTPINKNNGQSNQKISSIRRKIFKLLEKVESRN